MKVNSLSLHCHLFRVIQSRRAYNWATERIELLMDLTLQNQEILRGTTGGTAAGKEKKKAVLKRILGKLFYLSMKYLYR